MQIYSRDVGQVFVAKVEAAKAEAKLRPPRLKLCNKHPRRGYTSAPMLSGRS